MADATTSNLRMYQVTFTGRFDGHEVTVVQAPSEVDARRQAWDWLARRRCTNNFRLTEIREIRNQGEF